MYSRNAKHDAKHLEAQAHGTLSELNSELHDAANRAGRTMRGLIDAASAEASHAKDVVSAQMDGVARQIEAKPLQSGLIALAAGFVLGRLFTRR